MLNRDIKRILLDKNIEFLYHANTVATACTFLRAGGLLSRGTVVDLGLEQTSQETDETDKMFDVFYDIFFDSDDIHRRAKKINLYGPVLFVYSIDLLDDLPDNIVGITRVNPKYWNSEMTDSDKYFQSPEELSLQYFKGVLTQHFTIRHWNTPLSFHHLIKIVLDNPKIGNTTYFEKACVEIERLTKTQFPESLFEIRCCDPECHCEGQYQGYKEGFTYHRFKTRCITG